MPQCRVSILTVAMVQMARKITRRWPWSCVLNLVMIKLCMLFRLEFSSLVLLLMITIPIAFKPSRDLYNWTRLGLPGYTMNCNFKTSPCNGKLIRSVWFDVDDASLTRWSARKNSCEKSTATARLFVCSFENDMQLSTFYYTFFNVFRDADQLIR